jgi:RNA polymerase sigma factor for flagellar operon FliA
MRNPVVAQFLRAMWRELGRTRCSRVRECLIEYYLPIVRRIAMRMHKQLPEHVRLDDLMSAGNFGLLAAVERFDLARQNQFETFARPVIRGAILDYLRDIDLLPRHERAMVSKLTNVVDELHSVLGRPPTATEIRERLGISVALLGRLMSSARQGRPISLARSRSGPDDARECREADFLEDESQPPAWDSIQREDLKQRITRGLSRSERLIVTLYYYEGMSMKEIGVALELSESRVSQIRTKLMARLRTQLADRELELAA